MSDELIKELKLKVEEFFANATDNDIKKALKEAGYESYTNMDPYALNIHKPVFPYNYSDNYSFTYSFDSSYKWEFNYFVSFDCQCIGLDSDDTPYKKAA